MRRATPPVYGPVVTPTPREEGDANAFQSVVRRTYDVLRSGIRSGRIGQGEPLVENSLVRNLGASRGAVRRALQMLAEDGLVVRQPRTGTRVAGQVFSVPLFEEVIPANHAESEAPELRMVVHPLERRIVTPIPFVRDRLELTRDAKVVLLDQLLVIDGEPVGVRTVYFTAPEDPAVTLGRLEATAHDPRSFRAVFSMLYDRELGSREAVIEAVPCEARASRLLNIAEGSPILMREMLQRDADGRPLSISHTHLRGDRLALFSTVDVSAG